MSASGTPPRYPQQGGSKLGLPQPGSSGTSIAESIRAIDAPRKRTVLEDLGEERESLLEGDETEQEYGSVTQSGEWCKRLPR